MKQYINFGFCLTLIACSATSNDALLSPKQFNDEGFVGLEQLGKTYEQIILDYELDGAEGETVFFSNCKDVEKTADTEVVTDQFQLLTLMKINCKAAEYFHQAPQQAKSYFPHSISKEWVKKLPALAVPDLGGESLKNREGALKDKEPSLKINSLTEKSANVLLSEDLDITYVVLASGDFNNDGTEDMLLRMDWSIISAFGSGFELLMLTKENPNAEMKIISRSHGEVRVGGKK